MISKKAIIHPNVKFGYNCIVEDFAIIGIHGRDNKGTELDTVIGDNFQTGNKTNIRELNEIGDNVSIGTLSVVEHHVKIGSGVRIHTHAFIPEYTILENGCWIVPNVVATNAKYPNSPNAKANLKGPHIMKYAIIGANSTLLPGVRIGEHALVGAGSVVTKDVPDRCVVAGNLAKVTDQIENLPYE